MPFVVHAVRDPSEETRWWLRSAAQSYGLRFEPQGEALSVTLPGSTGALALTGWEGAPEALVLTTMLNWMNHCTESQLEAMGLDALGRPLPEGAVCVP
jgi:hypothetical protein